MNKKGLSTGFSWIYVLAGLFVIAILFVVFNQVITFDVAPQGDLLRNQSIASNESLEESNEEITKYRRIFTAFPLILFFSAIIFLVVSAIRAGRDDIEQ